MLMQNLIHDTRYALRQLRRAPGFAFTVVLTLALGVGVATAVFCVLDAEILRPLPYAQQEKIIAFKTDSRSGYDQPASWPSFQDERAQAHSFVALAGYITSQIPVVTPSSGTASLPNLEASDNIFQVFGVKPILGRTFMPGEEQTGKNEVMVLSYEVWQSYFGGNRNVLNQTVSVDGQMYAIIGVMPDSFRFPLGMHSGIYIPMRLNKPGMKERGNHWLSTVARLKDGVTIEQAQAEMTQIFSNLGKSYTESDEGRTVHLMPLTQYILGASARALWTLVGAVLAVLAIGCVNVAGLLLARGVKREREMAMRVAVGAGRWRLIRQVLTEGLLLALLGAAGGALMATVILHLMSGFMEHALTRGTDIQMNWTVLAAAIGIAVVASLAASLYPALRLSGIDPNRVLKSGGSAGTGRGQYRLRSGFVMTQVALTLVLLAISGLLISVVTRYLHTDLGFDSAHILSVEFDLTATRYQGRDPVSEFYRPLEERVSHLPGVQAAGLINLLPIREYGNNSEIHIAGQPPYPPHQQMLVENRLVSTGYFDVLGIPLHRGRRLSSALDHPENKMRTVVVNDAFVRKFIPTGLDPTAQRIDGDTPEEGTQIVGVSGNVHQSLFEPPMAEWDLLMDEIPLKDRVASLTHMTLLVRTAGDPTQAISAVRSIMHDLDPTVSTRPPRTMTEIVSETLVFPRMLSWLFGIFATLALVLALVGIYGIISHEVEQSARDIGVRMAMGATRQGILTMVMRRVLWMLGMGTIAGLVLTVIARKLIASMLVIEAQKETGELLLVVLLFVVAGVVATLIPAYRAASIEPMQALRNE